MLRPLVRFEADTADIHDAGDLVETTAWTQLAEPHWTISSCGIIGKQQLQSEVRERSSTA